MANCANWPVSIPGPVAVQVTVSTTSVTGVPSSLYTGGSIVRLVTATFQPAIGCGRTVRIGVSSGMRTETFVVAGLPASVGTPRVTTPKPPGPAPSS